MPKEDIGAPPGVPAVTIRLPLLGIAAAAFVSAIACGANERMAALTAAVHDAVAATSAGSARPKAADLRAFYAARVGAPAWVNDEAPTRHAAKALDVLRSAVDHGLSPAAYAEPELTRTFDELTDEEKDEKAPADVLARTLAQFEVRLTASLLSLGREVAVGRGPAEPGKPGGSRRATPDLAGSLNRAAEEGKLADWLRRIQPVHPEYAALQKALAGLQGRHGVPPPEVVAATGAPPGRVETSLISANLQRWRRLPDAFGDRHFLVNIPEYHLYAREQGRAALDMKVIVGTPDNRTPVFSDEMEIVVFSPYWNIPDTIVAGETAPAVARDPRYLARNQIEIIRASKDGVTRVQPSDVDWNDPEALKQLAFRQRPGAQNALGHIKFLFPNDYNVYLHDTPADKLFARSGRAFSHGCIRVEDPEALAKYVLRGYPEWTDEAIREAMYSGVEKHVKLTAAIPVHIVYFTARVEPDGRLRLWRDIYSLDNK
jgi:murein L,D-transpeptidase YcbB/YkuD